MGLNIFSKAESFLREKGQEFVDGAKQVYTDMIDQASDAIKSVTPEGAHQAITEISGGVASLGRDAIDFFDPVSYGADLLADGLQLLQPEHQVNKYLDVALLAQGKGDQEKTRKDLVDNLVDEGLFTVQAGALAIPSGHIAGKAAGKALKKGVKSAKTALKQTEKGTAEHTVAKQRLKKARRKKFAGQRAAKYSGKLVDQTVRDITTNERSKLHPGIVPKSSHIKKRDWSKFGQNKTKEVRDNFPDRAPVPRRGD